MNRMLQLLKNRWPVVAGTLVAGGLALLFFLNPVEHAFYPQCLFHRVTGLNCPGCGGLRAVHQLLHGHFETAFRLNPLFVLALPIGIIFFTGCIWRRARGKKKSLAIHLAWVWIGVAVVIAFGIARNLPFAPFAWMSQLPP